MGFHIPKIWQILKCFARQRLIIWTRNCSKLSRRKNLKCECNLKKIKKSWTNSYNIWFLKSESSLFFLNLFVTCVFYDMFLTIHFLICFWNFSSDRFGRERKKNLTWSAGAHSYLTGLLLKGEFRASRTCHSSATNVKF